MSKCLKCGALESEVAFLREQLKGVTDRLIALSSNTAFQAVSRKPSNPDEYYGSSSKDQYLSADEMGLPILVEKFVEVKSDEVSV